MLQKTTTKLNFLSNTFYKDNPNKKNYSAKLIGKNSMMLLRKGLNTFKNYSNMCIAQKRSWKLIPWYNGRHGRIIGGSGANNYLLTATLCKTSSFILLSQHFMHRSTLKKQIIFFFVHCY